MVNALVGMDDGMNLDAALLLPRLRVAAYALEYNVGKQGHGREVNNPQPFHPFLSAVMAAVRRKFVLVRLVKVTVNVLEELSPHLALASDSVLRLGAFSMPM